MREVQARKKSDVISCLRPCLWELSEQLRLGPASVGASRPVIRFHLDVCSCSVVCLPLIITEAKSQRCTVFASRLFHYLAPNDLFLHTLQGWLGS